jgi:3-methyladenine DNA glycosylase/8-oxoguanine DNA glycosylase
VPGLPGDLTHVFPDAETVTSVSLAAIGFPVADATAAESLAMGLARAGSAAGPGASLDALAALPGVGQDVRDYIALRLGWREVFPAGDTSLAAALADLGLAAPGTAASPVPWAERWQSWQALAAVHLMAHGDRLVRQAKPA